jgi:hypothetical protein
MKTRPLRGLALTELGFGGASLGNLYREVSAPEARLAADAAWDAGALAAAGPGARLCVLPEGPQTIPYVETSPVEGRHG